jgi:hypothetical protein
MPLSSQDFGAQWHFFFAMYGKLDTDIQLQLQSEIPRLMEEYRARLRSIQWDEQGRAEREALEDAGT